MAHALRHLIRIALLAAVLAPALWAQAGPPAVRFTVFAAKPITNLSFVPRPNAPPQKLQFFPTARSARAEYRGAMPLRFTDSESGEVVAEAAIPAGMIDVLLLFSPLASAPKSGGLRYQIAVLDDSAARHAAGGLAIINLSGLALSGTVNKENVALQPGLNPTVTVGRGATIALKTQFKGRTYQSYTGTAALKAGERVLLILFPPFYAGSLEVQSRLLVDQPGGSSAKRTETREPTKR
ncbi:MAG: hypothetical protein JNL39_20010 [Opitutaceae bacterium]|nr:hypothetical protein [Opitutaceae bacterium]